MRHPEAAAGGSTDLAPADHALSYGLRLAVLSGEGRGRRLSVGVGSVRIGSAADNDLVLADRLVSRHHAEVSSHPGGVRVRDLGSRNGIMLGGVRVHDAVVPPGAMLKLGGCEVLVEPEQGPPEIEPANTPRLGALIGCSLAMRRIYTIVERVASTDYTVLVEGETGTGKEVFARTLHDLSARRGGPLVVFDCSSVGESLVESELFGHVRGAFTGAVAAREGAFRRAHRGTLFIDEVNSLPATLQGKLLRALETRRIQPVGAD